MATPRKTVLAGVLTISATTGGSLPARVSVILKMALAPAEVDDASRVTTPFCTSPARPRAPRPAPMEMLAGVPAAQVTPSAEVHFETPPGPLVRSSAM